MTARQAAASEVLLDVDRRARTAIAIDPNEVKLGAGRVDDAARNLLTFAERVNPGPGRAPAALAIIVPGGYGYLRDDGVGVIPLGALGP